MDPTPNVRALPSLHEFYQDLFSIDAPIDSECSICYEKFESSGETVSVEPCKHVFHRICIAKWFHMQLTINGVTKRQDEATCPMCRCALFSAAGYEASQISIHIWHQYVWGFRGCELEVPAQQALDELADATLVGMDWVKFSIRELMKIDRDTIRSIACDLGFENMVTSPVPYAISRLATQLYEVHLDTENDQRFINSTIRNDIMALDVILRGNIPLDVITNSVSWLDELIDQRFRDWQDNQYPRIDFITMRPLHNLTICAGMIYRVRQAGSPNDSTARFAQLLAHGDAMLLRAQEQARSGALSESEQREYHRLLNYDDNRQPQSAYIIMYSNNDPRVRWIVDLRIHTRGRNADPLGPPLH